MGQAITCIECGRPIEGGDIVGEGPLAHKECPAKEQHPENEGNTRILIFNDGWTELDQYRCLEDAIRFSTDKVTVPYRVQEWIDVRWSQELGFWRDHIWRDPTINPEPGEVDAEALLEETATAQAEFWRLLSDLEDALNLDIEDIDSLDLGLMDLSNETVESLREHARDGAADAKV